MTFKFTNEDTGREFSFKSEEAYGRALDWYNDRDNSKAEMIKLCSDHGVDLFEATDDPYFKSGRKLVDDWADVAMEIWARNNDA
jgi:hypothetical protein